MSDNTIRLDDRDGWLLSLTFKEQRAFLDVRLFLVAIGRLHGSQCCQASFNTAEDMHKFFTIFAKEMGWHQPLYQAQSDTGRCPAVTLYLRDDISRKEPSFWHIVPWLYDTKREWIFEESPVKEKALEAARVVCNAWLPSWKW